MYYIKMFPYKSIFFNKITLFVILTFVFQSLMIHLTVPQVMEYSNGMKLLDMMFTGYTVEYAKLLFDTLGEQGRNLYLYRQIPLDFVFPGLSMISCILIIKKIYKNLVSNKILNILYVMPILGASFDYLENFGIIHMILNYPNSIEKVAYFTNIFCISKAIFDTIGFMIIILGVVYLISQKYLFKPTLHSK